MNSPLNIMQAPSYEDTIAAYNLEILKPGGDLQISATGDLQLTPDGDLKLGGDGFNAMFRLVRRWCFNAPTLAVMFDAIARTQEQKQGYEAEKNDIASILFDDPQAIQKFHLLTDEIGASEFGCAAYAGTIMVVLGNLLARFKSDLNATQDDWKQAPPLIEGYSVGAIIDAAANNFRHHDEWAKTEPPSQQQLRSISVIAAVLKIAIEPNGARHPFRQNVCPDVVATLSGDSFEQLNRNLFDFATSMVSLRCKPVELWVQPT